MMPYLRMTRFLARDKEIMGYARRVVPKYGCPMPVPEACGSCSCGKRCGMGFLEGEWRRRFLAGKVPRFHPARQVIFGEGDWPQGIMILCWGSVKLSLRSRQGRQMALRFCSCGDVFGDAAYLAGTTHPYSAEASTNAYVCLVPRPLADELAAGCPEFLRRMAAKSGQELGFMTNLVSGWLFQSADAKLAGFLLSIAERGDGPRCGLVRRFNRRLVAEHVGLSPETVVRRLGEFKRLGFVKFSGGSVELLDRTGLKAMACDGSPAPAGLWAASA